MGPETPSLAGGGDRVGLLPLDPRGVSPEPLEVVVGPLLRPEHVDHDVDVVEEPPARIALALASSRANAQLLLQGPLDLLDHRTDLPGGRGRADHEVVGDHDQPAHVQDHDVLGLLRGGGSGGGGGRVAARRDLPARPLLVRIRHPVKSSPTMIVMSPIPDGTCDTPTRPTPSASTIRLASASAACPLATTRVRSKPNGSAFRDNATRNPSGRIRAATSSPRPGAPTPFSTITGTGSEAPKDDATCRSRAGWLGITTFPATDSVGNSARPAPAAPPSTRRTPPRPLVSTTSPRSSRIGSRSSAWTTAAHRASRPSARSESSATTCRPRSRDGPGPRSPALVA